MGGILGSSGGLTAAQQAQLQAMLKATKAPASTIPALLMRLGGVPNRTSASNLAREAQFTLKTRRGYKDTVATSPMGDSGFGTSLSMPKLTGQTA